MSRITIDRLPRTSIDHLPAVEELTAEQRQELYGAGLRQDQLKLEGLEDRNMMATNLTVQLLPTTTSLSILQVTGTAGNDVIQIRQSQSNPIDASTRKMWIEGVPGTYDSSKLSAIYVYGLGGDDVIDLDSSAVYQGKAITLNTYLNGGAGLNRITGGEGKNTIVGGDQKDIIKGGSGDDLIYGQGGDDEIDAGPGNDTVYGGDGNDIIVGGLGNDTLLGEAGNDIINGGIGDDVIWGGTGDDALYGYENHDIIYGEAGNDDIFGGADDDYLYGGTGDDQIYGDLGNDWLFGEAGNDLLLGGQGDDVLLGSDGRDLLAGGVGRDLVLGGAGADDLQQGIDDVLISGTTPFETNIDALVALKNEWQRTDRTFAQRATALLHGGGLNGTFALTGQIFDDGAKDVLAGVAGSTFFLGTWTGANADQGLSGNVKASNTPSREQASLAILQGTWSFIDYHNVQDPSSAFGFDLNITFTFSNFFVGTVSGGGSAPGTVDTSHSVSGSWDATQQILRFTTNLPGAGQRDYVVHVHLNEFGRWMMTSLDTTVAEALRREF